MMVNSEVELKREENILIHFKDKVKEYLTQEPVIDEYSIQNVKT